MQLRIGQGFDIHQLTENRDLILGGIKIPCEKGLLGHSDADALIHAIIDSILGALALGNIGQYFPDNSPEFKNIDSSILLTKTLEMMNNEGYKIINLDTTVQAQIPKLNPWTMQIRENLAKIMHLNISQISVKPKTYEKLDSIGNSQAIAVYCNCLLCKEK